MRFIVLKNKNSLAFDFAGDYSFHINVFNNGVSGFTRIRWKMFRWHPFDLHTFPLTLKTNSAEMHLK